MTYRRLSPLMLVLAVASHASVLAQTVTGSGAAQLYRVAPPSDYGSGCFAPCMCPYMTQDGLIGTFRLTPTMPDPLYAHYDVTDVSLLLPQSGTRIIGSGTYKVRELAPFTQQMVLDLTIDGQGAQHFDSGEVQTSTAFPAIDATVSLNGMMTCQDTRLRVAAGPVPPKEEVPYALLDSLYKEGCFGPCACPITTKPLLGRFG